MLTSGWNPGLSFILAAMGQLLLALITKSEGWTFPLNNPKEVKERVLQLLHFHS